MDIHADILEDFSRALADFGDVLMVKKLSNVVRDAQIFSFIRANDVFRALIRNIYTENSDDETLESEQMIVALCALDIVTDEQAKRLIQQSDSADLLALDRSWFDVAEDVQYYDEEVAALSTYYEDMSILLSNLSNVGTLVTSEECHEGH